MKWKINYYITENAFKAGIPAFMKQSMAIDILLLVGHKIGSNIVSLDSLIFNKYNHS